jgi:hypothetical protein
MVVFSNCDVRTCGDDFITGSMYMTYGIDIFYKDQSWGDKRTVNTRG